MSSHTILTMVLTLIFMVSQTAVAGDIRKIRGEAHYHSPRTETPDDARKNAIHEARIDALQKVFSTTASEHTLIISDTRDSHTANTSRIHSESTINGEWIHDITEPEIKTEDSEYGTIYHVKVYGEAREIKYNRIDTDCRLLCNSTDPDRGRLRGDTFYEGEDMYVYFNSPVDGWLAIYLVDDDDQMTTQRLVPYDGQSIAAYPIVADKEYIFFSKRDAEPQYVDYVTGMVVEARKKTDVNTLHVIFSPEEFTQVATRPYSQVHHSDDDIDMPANLMPRETTFIEFDKWLHKKRRNDANLQPIQFTFSISKK